MRFRRAGKEDPAQLPLDFGVGQIGCPFFGHDNNILWRQGLPVATEKFPEQPFHPVAPDGFPQTFGHHQPEPRPGARPRGQDDAEVRRVQPFPRRLGRQVFPAPAQAGRLGETGFPWGPGGAFLRRLVGEAWEAAQGGSRRR